MVSDKETESIRAKFSVELSSKSSKDMCDITLDLVRVLEYSQKTGEIQAQLDAVKFAIRVMETLARKKVEAEKAGAATVTL